MEYIQSMDLEKGNRLPSEEKLSTMFGVSRVTIRSALKELEMEGRIFSRHGSGTYVNPMARRIAFNLAVPELYENIIRKGGRTPDVRVEGVITEAAGGRSRLITWRVFGGDHGCRKEDIFRGGQVFHVLYRSFPEGAAYQGADAELL